MNLEGETLNRLIPLHALYRDGFADLFPEIYKTLGIWAMKEFSIMILLVRVKNNSVSRRKQVELVT